MTRDERKGAVRTKASMAWTLAITSIALFMVVLDNLVVSTALPVIRVELGASVEQLEWTVNGYTLPFAVLLITGAALGDRFGRRLVFSLGLVLFTAASALAALAPSMDVLIAARAVQGAGAAMVMPLTLTLLSGAFPAERRGAVLGLWGAVGGVAIASGPLIGGAVIEGISWQWIFWLNVPVGLGLVPLALTRLQESHGADRSLDMPGLAFVSGGLLALVWGLVNGNAHGWGSATIVASIAAGVALLGLFVAWELRAAAPMVPMRFFAKRDFAVANVASLLANFGMFGAIFLLSQFFQTVQGLSPLEAGLRVLPWTLMPMIVAPIAGALSDRVGGRQLLAAGLALQSAGLAWSAAVLEPAAAWGTIIVPFAVTGIGMGMFFAPLANTILGSVRADEEGKASGVNSAVREVGGLLGVAVLASIFASAGGYGSPQAFVDGLVPATAVGAAVVGAGALVTLALPRRREAGEGLVTPPASRAAADGPARPQAASAS